MPADQHSSMFGQRASSHTVTSLSSSFKLPTIEKFSLIIADLQQSGRGLVALSHRTLIWLSARNDISLLMVAARPIDLDQITHDACTCDSVNIRHSNWRQKFAARRSITSMIDTR